MKKYVLFQVKNQDYALSINEVQSIEPMQSVTRVPTDISYVRGVMNLRGTVIPVIDLAARMGVGQVDATSESRMIVLSHDDAVVGMMVDTAQSVVDLEDDELQPVVDEEDAVFARNIARIENRVLYILDSARVTKIDE